MTTALTNNGMSKKFLTLAATLMMAMGVITTTQIQTAEAGRGGRTVAGIVAGAALLAIIASESRRDRRYSRRHRRSSYYDDGYYDRPYHHHRNRYGRSYRCYKHHGRRRHSYY